MMWEGCGGGNGKGVVGGDEQQGGKGRALVVEEEQRGGGDGRGGRLSQWRRDEVGRRE